MPDTLVVPHTAPCVAAREVARAYCSAALLGHCERSYLWAAALGSAEGLAFDAELLYVAALLHDLGLVPEFDSHTVDFAETGGHVAWVFAAGAGWPPERRRRLAEVIERHMADAVDPARDVEGHLLERGTSVDVTGHGLDALPAALTADVLARHPRPGFPEEFLACFRAQAHRKPASTAAAAVRAGLADRALAHPLDHP
ncbi:MULTISPECIES: HD domain-containing protein [Streptomyces]|uniref:HD domain-containing protein n=1 Tax=Streptomyces TaxID=1883 RepID=UPI002248A68F|nr:HD domain-containing protein [Streptomyces sp. JHD 1]MCX2968818.1 HD domain-containing protein [Streptomyces sp. JHD 1]